MGNTGRERLERYDITGPENLAAVEAGLADATWFRSAVPRKRMKELMKRSDYPAVRDTIIWVGLILAWRQLADQPRVQLADLPTPLQPLPKLSDQLGIKLWIKRDDQTGLAMGGNKTRKLEFLVGRALQEGADTLITAGAAQSNHCRQTAAAADDALRKQLCVRHARGPEDPARPVRRS